MKKILIIGMLVITGLTYANDSEGRERSKLRRDELRMKQNLNKDQAMVSRTREVQIDPFEILERLDRDDRGSDKH